MIGNRLLAGRFLVHFHLDKDGGMWYNEDAARKTVQIEYRALRLTENVGKPQGNRVYGGGHPMRGKIARTADRLGTQIPPFERVCALFLFVDRPHIFYAGGNTHEKSRDHHGQ